MLRTASSLPLAGLLTLGFDPTRFQMKPPACYRATWQLPEPDSHRQATTSLRTANHLQRQPPAPLDARKIEANAPGRELPALSGVLGPAARADGVLFQRCGFRLLRPPPSVGTRLSAPPWCRRVVRHHAQDRQAYCGTRRSRRRAAAAGAAAP